MTRCGIRIPHWHRGLIDWPLAATFIGGGAVGSLFGTRVAIRLADRRGALSFVLASLIIVVALYMLYRTAVELGYLTRPLLKAVSVSG